MKIEYTKKFIAGNLDGVKIKETMEFVNMSRADIWVSAIQKNKHIDYIIEDVIYQA